MTVAYGNVAGVVSGVDSETYRNYSDNGRDVVNGTTTLTNPNILTGPTRYDSHLTMTGHDSGSTDIDVSFTGIDTGQVKVTGTASVSYNGTTVTGVPHVPAHCPQDLPRKPHTVVTATVVRRQGHRYLHVQVTGRIAGDNPNEAATEIAPVADAVVRVGRLHGRTNRAGMLKLRIPAGWRGRRVVHISAGDTLRPAKTAVRL